MIRRILGAIAIAVCALCPASAQRSGVDGIWNSTAAGQQGISNAPHSAAPLTPCGNQQFDFSDTTGCNLVSGIEILGI